MQKETLKQIPPWLPPMAAVPPTEEIREAVEKQNAEQKLEAETKKQNSLTAEEATEASSHVDMRTLGSHTLLSRMNPNARALRELFAQEYIYDFDPVRAAQRCGYLGKRAISAARKLMSEPAVQRLIRERQSEFGSIVKLKQDDVIASLWKEGNREDAGSSHSARVAALKTVAQILNIAKPDEINVNVGGVMQVPGVIGANDWEQAAAAQQAKLKDEVRD